MHKDLFATHIATISYKVFTDLLDRGDVKGYWRFVKNHDLGIMNEFVGAIYRNVRRHELTLKGDECEESEESEEPTAMEGTKKVTTKKVKGGTDWVVSGKKLKRYFKERVKEVFKEVFVNNNYLGIDFLLDKYIDDKLKAGDIDQLLFLYNSNIVLHREDILNYIDYRSEKVLSCSYPTYLYHSQSNRDYYWAMGEEKRKALEAGLERIYRRKRVPFQLFV